MKEFDLETGWIRKPQEGSSIRARHEWAKFEIKVKLKRDKNVHPKFRSQQKFQIKPIETDYTIINNN